MATAVGGTPEIVLDQVTGLLVPPGDADALAAGLQAAVDDSPARERWGAAAREHVLTTFAMDRMLSEFASLYAALVRASRRGRGGRKARRGEIDG